jgi:hypothetical protein
LADDAREGWFYLKRFLFTNRLRRAAFEGFAAKGDVLWRLWLAEDEALADVVVAAEMLRGGGRAQAAVNAGGIDVESTLPLAENFEREVVVLTRKHRKLPPHVARFVENILF